MTLRLLRSTLIIAGLCLLTALPSAAQGRRSPRVHGTRVARSASTALSPAALISLSKAAVVTLPWFDNIENGVAGWTSTGFWHTPYRPQQISVLSPTINPDLVTLPDAGNLPAPFSGNYAWWYGQNSTGTFIGSFTESAQSPLNGGLSDSANSGDLITPPISLVGVDSALLSFWTWWEVEGVDANSFDLMSIGASSDGGLTWNPLGRGQLNPLNDPSGAPYKSYTSNGLGQRGSWTQQLFDLRAYAGKTIFIRFEFATEDEKYNGFRGWFIDDVGVSGGAVGIPHIDLVRPPVINPALTSVMDITGYNFVNGATILVDGNTVAAGVLSASLAQLDPTGLTTGVHTVTITNPDGKTSNRALFTVTSATPPLFSTVQPDSSPVGIGVPITITGNHFRQGVSVSIGGVPLPGPKLVDSTTIQVVAPSTLPIGIYNIVVSNPDSLSDIGILSFRITPFVYAVGDSLTGKAQTLHLAPVSSLYTSGKVFYRMAGKIPYDSLALTGGAGQFSVDLPAGVITIRGVEYYLRLVSVQGVVLAYPGINPSLAPAILPVRVQRVLPPIPPVAGKYRMVSSPLVLDDPFVMAQLGDDYGTYNPAKWRVFRWVRNGYHEIVPYVGLTMDPGDAVWVVTAAGAPFSLKRGVSVPSDQPFTVPVDTGWNQIADPFAFNVAWSGVGGSQSMTGPYFYDGVQYRLVSTTLAPYEGYFVYNPGNSETSSLYFYPVEDTSAVLLHRESGPVASLKPGEFVIQLSAAMPGTAYQDTYNYLGFRNGATAGRDRLDAPKPPPIGNGIQVNIVDGGALYLENYKPAGDQGASWIIGVNGAGTKGKILLTLASSGTLPAGFSLHVLDLANENAVPGMPGAFEVGLDAPNAPRYFKVIIGTDEFASKESQGIPLQPVAYALEQNYPNPFNPSTTIRYSLAKKGDVVLEIFNTLGQRVRTLANGVQTTGDYAVTWDGTSDSGVHIASGVYFCRLRTGEFTAVRKLAMIR